MSSNFEKCETQLRERSIQGTTFDWVGDDCGAESCSIP